MWASLSSWLLLGNLAATTAQGVSPALADSEARIALLEKQDRLRHRVLRVDHLSSVQLVPFRQQGSAPLSSRGAILVLHVWSVHCVPCVKEMPELQRMLASMKGDGRLRVVFVSQDSAEDLQRYWGEWQQQLPLAPKFEFYLASPDSQLQSSLQSTTLPLTLIVDAQMVVREAFAGPLLERGNQLLSAVRRLCRSAGAECRAVF